MRYLAALLALLLPVEASAQVVYGVPALHGGTIDGATITGSNIGASDASAANVTPTGGIAPRTLAKRFADVINAVDYATCDGSTTTTTSLQSAIAAAAGKARVYIPPGVTCVSGSVSLPSNTYLVIDGTLKLAAATNASLVRVASNATNVVVEGSGTIDGNKTAQTSGTSAGIDNQGSPTYVWIRGLTITNVQNWPVNLTNVTHAWLSQVTMKDSGNSPEFAIASSDCWADHLSITNITNDQGFAFYGATHHCGISSSYVAGGHAHGIAVMNDSAQTGIPHDITITGNVVTGNLASGVFVSKGSGSLGNPYNVVITGNDLTGNNQGNITSYGGVYLFSATNVNISGNSISRDGNGSNGSTGIFISTNVNFVSITGNTIFDEGQGGTNGVGFTPAAASGSVLLADNLFYDDQTPQTMAFDTTGTVGGSYRILNNTFGATIGSPSNTMIPAADTQFEAPIGSTYATLSPTNGANVTLGNYASGYNLTNAGTVAAFTLTMPTNPPKYWTVSVQCDGVITAFTVAANAGQTITGAPTACAAAQVYKWRYVGTVWKPY